MLANPIHKIDRTIFFINSIKFYTHQLRLEKTFLYTKMELILSNTANFVFSLLLNLWSLMNIIYLLRDIVRYTAVRVSGSG